MPYRFTIFALLCFFLPVVAHGKENKKEKKDTLIADYYYNHMEFHKAIPLYEKAADTFRSAATYGKLGDCYRLTLDLKQAEKAYEKAVNMPGCTDLVKLQYASVLMEDTQYVNAARWLAEYHKSNPADERVANLMAGCAAAPAAWHTIPSGYVDFASFNTDGSEFAPTLWKGRLVFTSDTVVNLKKKTDNWTGNKYYNIYSIATDGKGNCGTDYTGFSKSKDLNIKYHDGPCTFSADGGTMYFTRNRFADKFLSKSSVANHDGVVLLEIMIATDYDTAKKEFKKITSFAYNSDKYSVAHPAVSPNGKVMAFVSNMPGGSGGSDIYICKSLGDGTWTAPVNAGNSINTEGEEVFPSWGDDKTLYFSSDGHEGLGGLDIYKSAYDEASSTFSKPENVGIPINSSYDDISLAMTADGGSTFLSSNRPAPMGGDNIWYYKRKKLFLAVDVKDSLTGKPITGAKVSFVSVSDNSQAITDAAGSVFRQLYLRTPYSLDITSAGYPENKISVSAPPASDNELDTVHEQVTLLQRNYAPPAKGLFLNLLVFDSATQQPLTDVHVVLEGRKDYRSEAVDDNGKLFLKLPPGEQYILQCQKIEYKTSYTSFATPEESKSDTITQRIGLSKINSDTLELGVIPFEFGKFDLNDTAKERLADLVHYLQLHPAMRIQLLGHTDCRGTAKANELLSKHRVQAVLNFLVQNGIAKNRLSAVGLGARFPKVKCNNCQFLNQPGNCTELDHYRNRSLDFKVLQR